MSWAAEEWKEGLPQKVLVKINQIESQLERFKKERDQKQFQLESLEQALDLQKRKGGNEKSEIASLKRENQSLTETCQDLEKGKEKLTNDLLLKENQVTGLEQKVTELGRQQDSEKNIDSVSKQQETESGHIIKSLEEEVVELRKQLTESNPASQAAKKGSGDELNTSKSLRHPSECEELRKTQQELLTLRALVSDLELKNKKLVQDGECTRHNTEAARQHLELRMKESEKELKREAAQSLEIAKNAERTLQESKSRWQQEINAALAEQLRLQGLVERLETDKASLMREQGDMSEKVAAAECVVKTRASDVAEAEKKMAALEVEKQKLTSELNQKSQETQTQSVELTKLKNDIGLREQTNDTLKGQIMDKTLEQERIKAEAGKMSQKLLQAENQLMDLQKHKQKTEEHLKEVSLSLNKFQSDNEKLEKSNAELSKQLLKVQGEVETLSASLKDNQAKMKQMEANFSDSQHKWKDLEGTLRSELAQNLTSLTQLNDLKMDMETQLSAKNGELLELTNQCKAREDKISSQDSEITQKAQSICGLEKQLQDLQDQLEITQKEYHQQNMFASEKMADVEAALKNRTEEVEIIRGKFSQERIGFEAEIDKLLSLTQTLECEVSSCRTECQSGQHLIMSLENEIGKLKTELETKDISLTEMNSIIQNQQRDLQERTEENGALKGEINQRDQHIHSLKDSLATAAKELETSQKELRLVSEKYDTLEIEKVSFISEVAACNEQIECGVQLNNDCEKKLTQLADQFEISQRECLSLSCQVNSEMEKNIHLEKEVKSLHDRCNELGKKIEDYKHKQEDMATVTGKLEEKCVELSHKLEEERTRNNIYENKVNTLDAQLAESSKLHQCVVDEMSEKLDDAMRGSGELKGLMEHAEDRVAELEKEVTRLKNCYADLETLHKSVKVELEEKAALALNVEARWASISDELTAVNLQLSEKEHLLSSHLGDLEQMQNRVKLLEEEKMLLETSSNKELDLLNGKLLQQGQNLGQKDFRILELEDLEDELTAKLADALKEVCESSAQHAHEVGMVKSKMDMLQMDVDDRECLIQDLNGKISNLTSLLENMTDERNSLKNIFQSTTLELEELQAASESEKARLDQITRELQTLRERNSNLEIILVNTQTELEGKVNLLDETDKNLEKAQMLVTEYEKKQQEFDMDKDRFLTRIIDLEQAESAEKELGVSKTKEIERLNESCASFSEKLETVTKQFYDQGLEIDLRTQNLQAVELKLKELDDASLRYEKRTCKELEDLQKLVLEREESLMQTTARKEELVNSNKDMRGKLSELELLKSEEDVQHDQVAAGLKSQLEMLQMDVEDKDDVIQELNTKICNLESQIEVMTHTKTKMDNVGTSLESEMMELKSALDAEREKIAQFMMSEDTLNDRIKNLESIVFETGQELQVAEKCLQNLRVECDKLGGINAGFEQQAQLFNDEKKDMIARIDDLQSCLDAEKQSGQSTTADLDRVTQQCTELSENLVNMKTDLSLHQEDIAVKIESLREMENKLKKREADVAELSESSGKDLEQLQQKLLEKDDDLSQRITRIEYLENYAADFEGKFKDALSEKSEEGVQHNEEFATLKSQLEMLQVDVEDKDGLIETLKTKICNLESQIEVMNQEAVIMQDTGMSLESEMTKLKSALDAETEMVAESRKKKDNLRDRITNLEFAVSETGQELERKDQLLLHLQSEWETSKGIISQYESNVKEFEDEKDNNLQQLSSSYKLEIESKTAELTTVSESCVRLAEDCQRFKSELVEKQEEIYAKAQSMFQMESRIDHLEKEKVAVEDGLYKENEELRTLLIQTKEHLREKSARIVDLENCNEVLKVKLSAITVEHNEESFPHVGVEAMLKSKPDTMQADLEAKEHTITDVNAKLLNLGDVLEGFSKEKSGTEEACDSMKAELALLRVQLATERGSNADTMNYIARHKDTIDLLNANLMNVRDLILKKGNNLNSSTESEDVLEQSHQNLTDLTLWQGTDLQNSDFELKVSSALEITSIIESGVAALSTHCSDLQEQLSTASSVVSSRSEEVQILTQKFYIMEVKLQQLEMNKKSLEEALNKDVDMLQELVPEKSGDLMQRASSQLEDAQLQLSRIHEDVDIKTSDNDHRQTELSEFASKLDELQNAMEEKGELINMLTNETAELKTALFTANGECDKLRADNAMLESEQESYEMLKAEHEGLVSERQQLQESYVILKAEHEGLVSERQQLQESYVILKAEHEGLVSERQQLQESHVILKAEHGLVSERQQLQESHVILKAEHEGLVSERQQLQESYEMLKAEHEGLVSERQQLQESYEMLKTEHEGLVSERQQLQVSYEMLNKEHEICISETERPQEATCDLANKLKEMTASFDQQKQHIIKLDCHLKEALNSSEELRLSLSQKVDQVTSLGTSVKDLENQLAFITSEKADLEKCHSQDMENMRLQLSTMKENQESKSNELALLKTQNDDLNMSLAGSNFKMDKLQVEYTSICGQFEEVQRLYTEVKSDLHGRDDTICILREELENALHENDILKTDKGEWQAKEEKHRQEFSDLEVKVMDLNTEIESTRESFESLSDQRFEAQGKLSSVILDKKDLEDKFESVQNELGEVRRFVKNVENLEARLEHSRQEVFMKDEEISNLKEQLDEISKSSKSDVLEIDVLRKQKEKLERRCNETKKSNEDLEEQLSEFTAVTKEMKEQLSELQDLIHTLNNNIDSKKKEIVQRLNEISEMNDEIFRLKAVVEEKEKNCTKMSQDMTKAQKENSSTVGTLEDAIESLNFELLATEAEKTSLISDNDVLKTENSELHEKIKRLTANVCEVGSGGTTASVEDLKTQILQLGKANAEMVKNSSSFEKDIKELEIQFEEKSKYASNLVTQAESLNEKLQEKITCCEDLSQQIKTLRTESSSSERHFKDLEAQLHYSKELEKSFTTKVSKMDNQITSLHFELASSKEKLMPLMNQHEQFLLQIEQMEIQNIKLMEEVKMESDNANTAKESLQKTVEELDIVLSKNAQLENKIQDYQLVLLERDELKERVETMESVEIEKDKMREREKSLLTEKVVQLEGALSSKRNVDKTLEGLVLERDSLQEMLKKVRTNNYELEENVKEMDQRIKDLTSENTSRQENLEVIDQKVKDLKSENTSLQDNMEWLNQKMRDLTFENISLRDNVEELNQKMRDLTSENTSHRDNVEELNQKMRDLTSENTSLRDNVEELNQKMRDLTSKNTSLLDNVEELNQKTRDLTSKNTSLRDNVEELNHKMGDLTSENTSLRDNVEELNHKMGDLTSENTSLRDNVEELNQKMRDLTSENTSVQDNVEELILKMRDLTSEKASLKEMLNKMESANCQLEDKVKEMAAVACEFSVVKEKVDEQERRLIAKTKELSQVNADRDQLENQVKKLKSSDISEPHSTNDNRSDMEAQKELLLKWEQRCSQLTVQLSMDRKKVQRLTEQVEKLKSSKGMDNVEDIKTLKDELEEVMQERESYKEKFLNISEAGEKHCIRVKQLQRLNEKLNSRNRLLNALLKGEKPKVIVPIVTSTTSKEGATKLDDEPPQAAISGVAKTVQENNAGLSSPTELPQQRTSTSEQPKALLPEKIKAPLYVQFDLKSETTTVSSDNVNAHPVVDGKMNTRSAGQDKIISIRSDQNLAEESDQVNATYSTRSYSTRQSSRLKLHSPKPQSALKSKIATPKSGSSQIARSTTPKSGIYSQIARLTTPKSNTSSQIVESIEKRKSEIPSINLAPLSNLKSRKLTEPDVLKMPASPPKMMPLSNASHDSISATTFQNNTSRLETIPPDLQPVNAPGQSHNFMSAPTFQNTIPPDIQSVNASGQFCDSISATTTFQTNTSRSRTIPPDYQSVTAPDQSHVSVLPPIFPLLTSGPRRIPSALQSVSASDQIRSTSSPRALRRMSLQKRRSADQSAQSAGGKKCKLSITETVTEVSAHSESKKLSQPTRLPQPGQPKLGTGSGLPRPTRTRATRETLLHEHALATITNSPKKMAVGDIKGSRRAKTLARKIQSPSKESADEKPPECSVN